MVTFGMMEGNWVGEKRNILLQVFLCSFNIFLTMEIYWPKSKLNTLKNKEMQFAK